MPNGLSHPSHPDWGGWGGRFAWWSGGLYRDAQDTIGSEKSARATVSRWRRAYQSDFEARMDWCVNDPSAANHHPRAIINGDATTRPIFITAASGSRVRLDASASTDPDNQRLVFRWWHYLEAGSVDVDVPQATAPVFEMTAPPEADRKTIHLILEVQDDGTPRLTSYRRVVLQTVNLSRWEKDIAAFEAADKKQAPEANGLLFVGSSTIRLWKDLKEDFPGHTVIQRGFGGSHMVDSLHYAERIIVPYKPSTIVLYAGDNDIAAGKTPGQVLADFQAFHLKVRAALPNTHILFLAVKASIKRWHLLENIRATNRLIAAYCMEEERLAYVDTFHLMLGPDGKPRPDLLVQDGLHLSRAGYELWAEMIRSHLLPPR